MSHTLLFPTCLSLVVAALTGCATPRFETVTHHIPPAGPEGLACIQGCEGKLSDCRADCQAAWESCTTRLEPQVDEAYARALKDYADELKLYRMQLSQAHWDLWLGWGHYDDHGYGSLWYSPWSYHSWPWYWPSYYPSAPSPGDPPTREAVRVELQKAQCKDDCDCQGEYDTCYQGCGGTLVQETRCVANCPEGK